MAPCDYYASSPTIALQPGAAHSFDSALVQSSSIYRPSIFRLHSFDRMAPSRSHSYRASSQLVSPSSSVRLKRTRDERDQHENNAGDWSYLAGGSPNPKTIHESVYDKMTPGTSPRHLPDTTDVGTYNGLLAGNDGCSSPLKHRSSSHRPDFRSRKSARIVSSNIRSEVITVSPRSTPPREMPEAPVVDDITLALGIGWKRVAEPQANAYKRIIEKQYKLQQVTVIAFSDSQSAYLAQAYYDDDRTNSDHGAFFLFDERFDEGQRVGWTWEETQHRLTGRLMIITVEANAKVERRDPQAHIDGLMDSCHSTGNSQNGFLDSNMEID